MHTIKHPSRLASRFSGIDKSIFSEMTRLAQQYQAINLGQGFPDFYGPEKLLQCISNQVLTCHNQYAPSAGEMALKEQVSHFISNRPLTFTPKRLRIPVGKLCLSDFTHQTPPWALPITTSGQLTGMSLMQLRQEGFL
jgi:hypothetical protein